MDTSSDSVLQENESTESVWRDEGPTMFSVDEVRKSNVSSKIRTAIRELKAKNALRYCNLSVDLFLYLYVLIYLPLGPMLGSLSSQEPTATKTEYQD